MACNIFLHYIITYIFHNYYIYFVAVDALSQVSWARRSEASSRSHISERASLISPLPEGAEGDVKLTPQQYGVLGKSFITKIIKLTSDVLYDFVPIKNVLICMHII